MTALKVETLHTLPLTSWILTKFKTGKPQILTVWHHSEIFQRNIYIQFFCLFYPSSLSFISPATLPHSLHSKLICALLSWDQAAFQKKQPHTSGIMGRFVRTEIEVLFFWNGIIFHWTPYHSLPHFYSKWNPHPQNLFLCFISSTWPPVASLLLLSDPLPHKHTPTHTLSSVT